MTGATFASGFTVRATAEVDAAIGVNDDTVGGSCLTMGCAGRTLVAAAAAVGVAVVGFLTRLPPPPEP